MSESNFTLRVLGVFCTVFVIGLWIEFATARGEETSKDTSELTIKIAPTYQDGEKENRIVVDFSSGIQTAIKNISDPTIPILGVLGAAILGGFISWKTTQSLSKKRIQYEKLAIAKREHLKNVTDKLNNFYVPFLVLTKTGSDLWSRFCLSTGRSQKDWFEYALIKDKNGAFEKKENGEYKVIPAPPDGKALVKWIHVKRETFLPLDLARETLFHNHAGQVDLSDNEIDNKIKNTIFHMMSHFGEARSVGKRWAQEAPENLTDPIFLERKYRESEETGGKNWFESEIGYPLDLGTVEGLTFALEEKVKKLDTKKQELLEFFEKKPDGWHKKLWKGILSIYNFLSGNKG